MATLKQIISGARLFSQGAPIESINIGRPGDPPYLIFYEGRIFVYNRQGQALVDAGLISALGIAAVSINAEKLQSGVKKFVHTLVFSSVDNNTVSWTSGRLTRADGTFVEINSGITGNLSQKYYLYFNGTPNLALTNLPNVATSNSNIPLAVLEPTSDPTGKAIITIFNNAGTTIDGDLITTGKIQSAEGHTYFDLNNDVLVVNDKINDRIIIGKIGAGHGIKVSLAGYDAINDTNINHFALWASSDDTEDNVLIKEKTRGSVSVPTGFGSRGIVAHGLSYIPLVFAFIESSPGVFTKAYGSSTFDDFYFYVTSTNIEMVNLTGSTKVFKYYIFYDEVD